MYSASPFFLGRVVAEGAMYTGSAQVGHIFPSWPELAVPFCLRSTDLICGALPFSGGKNVLLHPGDTDLPEGFLNIRSAVLVYQGLA